MLIATDGSCTNNGKKHAVAGFGVVCDDGTIIYGPVKGHRVKDVKFPETIYYSASQTPTNNRGELFGIMYALYYARTLPVGEFIIVTDSVYCKNVFTTWYKKWIEEGTFYSKLNQDVIVLIANLQEQLKQDGYDITIIWQKAHVPSKYETKLSKLNTQADEYANMGRTADEPQVIRPLNANFSGLRI